MKSSRLFLPLASLLLAAGNFACEDDVSGIGGSISSGEVTISVDSLVYDLKATAVENNRFDSRSGNLLLGNIDVPEYGSLNCSFVTRFLCINSLPESFDTIPMERLDSCKFILGMSKGGLTGDSLAPQQLTAYRLSKQLPSDISNEFNPSGYYSPADIVGRKNYTATTRELSDSLMITENVIEVHLPVPLDMGKKFVKAYHDSPEIFQWPQTFAQYFPGLYVEPTFGKGLISNVIGMRFRIYYHNLEKTTAVTDGDTVVSVKHVPASINILTTAPEVLSSNNISYKVSDHIKGLIAAGKSIITTPGGYTSRFTFPAREIIADYQNKAHNLSIISNLTMNLPAEPVENDFGLGVAPYMLMIKTSEIDDFFNNNRLPDNKTSFTATYDSVNKRYQFNSLRQYLLDILKKGNVTDSDVDFSFIPVYIRSEASGELYSTATYVTQCVPYTYAPTMTSIDTKKADIIFSFSSQLIE